MNIGPVNYQEIVEILREAFRSRQIQVPDRHHYSLPHGNTSLIMPAWNDKYFGLKQIIACPSNHIENLPTIQGAYHLSDVRNGKLLADIDARKLTSIRTAATSVLASSFFLDHPKKLVLFGNGVVAKQLKEAYCQFYDLEEVVVWTRGNSRDIDLSLELRDADIISCATLAEKPILFGKAISDHTHIDLVGSFKPHMREADDEVIRKSELYIDDWPALKESGDLSTPLKQGIIIKEDIQATLFDLCSGKKKPNKSSRPTLFKSVGHALEDLAVAVYLYERYF